jgi:hypothetical protein
MNILGCPLMEFRFLRTCMSISAFATGTGPSSISQIDETGPDDIYGSL